MLQSIITGPAFLVCSAEWRVRDKSDAADEQAHTQRGGVGRETTEAKLRAPRASWLPVQGGGMPKLLRRPTMAPSRATACRWLMRGPS